MRAAGVALVTVLVAATVVLGSLYDEGGFDSSLLLVGAWAVLGAVIAALRPRNPVGWLFLAFGLWMGDRARPVLRARAPRHGRPAHLGLVAQRVVLARGFGIVIASLFFIPTGRLPSRRLAAGARRLLGRGGSVRSHGRTAGDAADDEPRPDRPQPARHPGVRRHRELGRPVLIAVLVGGAAAGAASLVVRYRRGAPRSGRS